jgi:hypothetical protein
MAYAIVNCFSINSTLIDRISFPQTKKLVLYNIATAEKIIPQNVVANQQALRVFNMGNTPVPWFPPAFLAPGGQNNRIQQVIMSGSSIEYLPETALQGNRFDPDPFQQLEFILDFSNNLLKWVPLNIFQGFLQQTQGYNANLNLGGNPWIQEAGPCKCKDPKFGLGLVAKSYQGQFWCECDKSKYGSRGCKCS